MCHYYHFYFDTTASPDKPMAAGTNGYGVRLDEQ